MRREIIETYFRDGAILARGAGVTITLSPPAGEDGESVVLAVQGGSKHGRRYFRESSYPQALAHAARWQRRRFGPA